MIGKTRTNIREEIDTQYEILLQMIADIADHYQDEAYRFKEEVYKIAEDNSDGDFNIKSSLLSNYDVPLERRFSLTYEARKILFCSIFSYFESMLYGLIAYFKIPRKKTNQLEQLIDKIAKEYVERYSEPLIFVGDKNRICDFYRPLRNKYMHGHIGNPSDKVKLRLYIEKEGSINSLSGYYEIRDNKFLRDSLNRINTFLIGIEEAYCKKEIENHWNNTYYKE